ncbi:MAG: hypothetical protein LH609_08635 [Rudanella sp.]|nr:hypothetical protein [Rudanella sp.]
MTEKEMLLDLKWIIESQLERFEEQLILSDPRDDHDEFSFLIKKATHHRDTLEKINQRLKELQNEN